MAVCQKSPQFEINLKNNCQNYVYKKHSLRYK